MVDVILSSDDLVVLGGPEEVNVEVDFGPKGDRGSLIFVGNGKPDLVDIGQTPNTFDLYINLLTTDDEYLMMYQYVEVLGTMQWQTLTKLIPKITTFCFVSTPNGRIIKEPKTIPRHI